MSFKLEGEAKIYLSEHQSYKESERIEARVLKSLIDDYFNPQDLYAQLINNVS